MADLPSLEVSDEVFYLDDNPREKQVSLTN